jgi:catechol 2,3-dioxygenase-like lactoylglutathione lyase family enzyme
MNDRRRQTSGLRHVALNVRDFEACLAFYTELLGMDVEWQPDDDSAFLTSGNDNLALRRSSGPAAKEGQRLDHIGFIIESPDDVDLWHEQLRAAGVPILKPPKSHRDGARSFFCEDPDGTLIQIIFHPPLAAG